ncbi:MAG: type II toxin-antitoxin system VapC family toxin [Desulfurococcaceae archaeon]
MKTSLSSRREQSLGGLELTEIVIDSSILAKFILRESGWEKVKDIISKRPYTLELAVKEVVNAMWKRVTLIKDISVEKAFVLLSDLLELKKKLLVVEPQDWYLSQALEISIKEEIPVYDSLFIAQAIAKQATLASSDRRQCQVAEKLNVKTLCI